MITAVRKELDDHRHLFGGSVEDNLRAVDLDPQMWDEWKAARDSKDGWSTLDAWEAANPLAAAAILAAYSRPMGSVDVAMV